MMQQEPGVGVQTVRMAGDTVYACIYVCAGEKKQWPDAKFKPALGELPELSLSGGKKANERK